MRQVVLYYKIGFREGVHTLEGLDELGVPGFGVRSRGSGFEGTVSAETFSDNGGRSCRIREAGLGLVPGASDFPLVGVDLVVTRILSGPRHRVGLGLRGEELGILEEHLSYPCR